MENYFEVMMSSTAPPGGEEDRSQAYYITEVPSSDFKHRIYIKTFREVMKKKDLNLMKTAESLLFHLFFRPHRRERSSDRRQICWTLKSTRWSRKTEPCRTLGS